MTGSPLSSLSGLAYSAGMLLLICVLAFLALRFLYGRGPVSRSGFSRRFIQVIDRYPLAPQRFLLIIEVAGKMYLLGVTEHSITFLSPLDAEALSKDPAWLEQSPAGFAPFSSYLSSLSRRWKKTKGDPPRA